MIIQLIQSIVLIILGIFLFINLGTECRGQAKLAHDRGDDG